MSTRATTGQSSTGRTSTAGARETGAIVGAFHSHADAQRAIRELKEAGFADSEIGVASRDHEGSFQDQTEGNKSGEGATAGAVTGLGAGALWGLGIAAGALPAIGPVIAGGTLAAIAASAAGTAVAGGLIGALVGLGIPEKEATYYNEEFEKGRTIVTVKSDHDRHRARAILDNSNSYDYERRDSAYASDAMAPKRVNVHGDMVDRADLR